MVEYSTKIKRYLSALNKMDFFNKKLITNTYFYKLLFKT